MSEAVVEAPKGQVPGIVGWVSWLNNKSTNQDKKDLAKAQGCTIPCWLVTTAGLTDAHQKLRAHVLQPGVQIWAKNDEATGGAILGTGITDEQYNDLSDDEKKVTGPDAWKPRRFIILGVVDEKNDIITPGIYEQGSWGSFYVTKQAEDNYSRPPLASQDQLTIPGFRTIFTGDATMGKNEKSGRPQISGQCQVSRVTNDDPNGVRAIRHLNDPQFKASCVACKEALSKKVAAILGEQV